MPATGGGALAHLVRGIQTERAEPHARAHGRHDALVEDVLGLGDDGCQRLRVLGLHGRHDLLAAVVAELATRLTGDAGRFADEDLLGLPQSARRILQLAEFLLTLPAEAHGALPNR